MYVNKHIYIIWNIFVLHLIGSSELILLLLLIQVKLSIYRIHIIIWKLFTILTII